MMTFFRLITIALATGLMSGYAWGQNLISNPGFDADVTGWSAGSNTTVQWNSLDADGSQTSGSALVTNTSTTAGDATGARQNIASITGGEFYAIFAEILIPGGQSATGRANLLVQWYDQANCTGQVGLFSTPWVTDATPGAWYPSFGTTQAPASAQCARVRLSVMKNEASDSLEAHFDNVVLTGDQVFADSFEACEEIVEGYPDFDEDGFGDASSPPFIFCRSIHYGYVDNALDCNDSAGDVFPGQVELCDDVDNDCDQSYDEDFLPGGSITFTGLFDGDTGKGLGQSCGTGTCLGGTIVCALDGSSLDCDTEAQAAEEVCDSLDNDCDGEVDEGCL